MKSTDEEERILDKFESRENVISIIDNLHLRGKFREIYMQSPEEYFREHCYDEPLIWQWVMDDLGVRTLKPCRIYTWNESAGYNVTISISGLDRKRLDLVRDCMKRIVEGP